MATPNGDIKAETAESFARDYIEDLFNNNKNLGAFEEETLDLNIKSKYDNIVVEEEEVKANNTATFTVETAASVYEEKEEDEEEKVPAAEAPLEPGIDSFQVQVNGHVDEEEFAQVTHNGDLEYGVPEPNQTEFVAQSEVPEPNQTEFVAQSEVLEPNKTEFVAQSEVLEPNQTEFVAQSEVFEPEVTQLRLENEESMETQQVSREEEEEADDVVAPIPSTRGKPGSESSEEELAEMQFKKLGLTKNWWDSKRNESEVQKEESKPVDKFRTIKQNIRKGNTRSLLARFEQLKE